MNNLIIRVNGMHLVIFILVFGKKEINMGKGSLFTLLEKSMKENGKMVNNMELVFTLQLVEKQERDNGVKEKE